MNRSRTADEIRQERLHQLMTHCERSILDSIIGPFGLHHAMFQDVDGGNLPTVRNADKDIFPNEKYKDNYSGFSPDKYVRRNYDDRKMRGPDWREVNARFDRGEVVNDSYSNKPLEKGKVHMDHVVSAKELSKDASLHLWNSENARKGIVNDGSNLAPTSASINTSKKDKSVKDYLSHPDKVNPDVDPDRMKKCDDVARQKIAKTEAKKIATDVSITVGKQALKLGIRQGVGIVLRATTLATFVETKDIYLNGFSSTPDDKLSTLMIRGNRVKAAALKSVPSALEGAAKGVLGGVISELLTWLINQAATTAKNLVRIIREGILKYVEAIKLLLNRPPEMTFDDALREATKIVAGVLGLALGIAAEESLKALLLTMPFVGAFAAEISAVMSGILAGVTMGVVVYLIDRLFDKLSMPFETQSLDKLAKTGNLQQQLLAGAADIAERYAGIIQKLSIVGDNYDATLADGTIIKHNYLAAIESSQATVAKILKA